MFDGTWIPKDAILGGRAFPRETLTTMTLTIDGDRYTARVGDMTDRGTVAVDAESTPVRIDITGVEGPNRGRRILAIGECEGETLRICYDLTGASHPRGFTSDEGTQQFLVTYQKVHA